MQIQVDVRKLDRIAFNSPKRLRDPPDPVVDEILGAHERLHSGERRVGKVPGAVPVAEGRVHVLHSGERVKEPKGVAAARDPFAQETRRAALVNAQLVHGPLSAWIRGQRLPQPGTEVPAGFGGDQRAALDPTVEAPGLRLAPRLVQDAIAFGVGQAAVGRHLVGRLPEDRRAHRPGRADQGADPAKEPGTEKMKAHGIVAGRRRPSPPPQNASPPSSPGSPRPSCAGCASRVRRSWHSRTERPARRPSSRGRRR